MHEKHGMDRGYVNGGDLKIDSGGSADYDRFFNASRGKLELLLSQRMDQADTHSLSLQPC